MVELKLRKSQEFTPPADTTVEMNPLGSPGESDHVVALDQIDFVPNLDSKPDTPTGRSLLTSLFSPAFATAHTAPDFQPHLILTVLVQVV